MLQKLIRLLKVKQRLSLDPISGNDIPADRYAVFRIEVSAMLHLFFQYSGVQMLVNKVISQLHFQYFVWIAMIGCSILRLVFWN